MPSMTLFMKTSFIKLKIYYTFKNFILFIIKKLQNIIKHKVICLHYLEKLTSINLTILNICIFINLFFKVNKSN